MQLPKAMLFDMGDTLIHEQRPDFRAGTERLISLAHNPRQVASEEVLGYAAELGECLLAGRDSSLMEFSCIGFHNLLFHRFGMTFNLSPAQVETEFRRTAFHSTLAPGIDNVLRHFNAQGVRCAVLSNAIFLAATLEAELMELGLRPYFEFVMSSAEYCLRKPHPLLFRTAVGRLGLSAQDVWYAGDHWDCDMLGAASIGMPTLWYNSAGKQCPDGLRPTLEISSWTRYLEML